MISVVKDYLTTGEWHEQPGMMVARESAEVVQERRRKIVDFVLKASRGPAATSAAIGHASEKFGLTRQAIRNHLRAVGVEVPTHSGQGATESSPATLYRIAKLRLDGLSMSEIAEDVGLSKQRVGVLVKTAREAGLVKK